MNFFTTAPLIKRKKDNRVFIVLIFFMLLILTLFVDPRDVSLLACHLKNSTGYSCPTCGLSRSFFSMAHLNIGESFDYHLLGPILYLCVVGVFVKSSMELILNKEIKTMIHPYVPKVLIAMIAVVWLISWLYNFL